MVIDSLSLKVGNKDILNNLSISFTSGNINHVLGKNGVGKSCFAKACAGFLKYTGKIDIQSNNIVVIGSYSNIPGNLKLEDLLQLLYKQKNQAVNGLIDQLNILSIDKNLFISKMSDGQKQKIKLLYFLSLNPKTIIFDEFTSALDKTSSFDIYNFLNEYLSNPEITSINITHNLSDLEYMPGSYYIFSDNSISKIEDKEQAIEKYIKGV